VNAAGAQRGGGAIYLLDARRLLPSEGRSRAASPSIFEKGRFSPPPERLESVV